MLNIETDLQENGSIFFTLVLKDESVPPKEVTPTTLSWTLTDLRGNVINSREDVVVTPEQETTIILSGDDLEVTEASKFVRRVILFSGTYDSDKQSGLPFTKQIKFKVYKNTKKEVG